MTRVLPFRSGRSELDWRCEVHAQQAQTIIAADEAMRLASEERARALDRLAFGMVALADEAARTARPLQGFSRRGHFTFPDGPGAA